jgi:MacB-like periplasmic core domain
MIFSLMREALRSMAGNRMRTFLTMLGLVIGVGAVVLMAAIGAGAQSQVELAIQSMGSNLFIVLPGSSTASGVRSGSGGVSTLTGPRPSRNSRRWRRQRRSTQDQGRWSMRGPIGVRKLSV